MGASFTMAARSYHVDINISDLGKLFYLTNVNTILKRISEINIVIINLLRPVPWGHLVTDKNCYLFIHFAIEFYELLLPMACARADQKKAREWTRNCQTSSGGWTPN